MAPKRQNVNFNTALNALFLMQETQKLAKVIEVRRQRSNIMPFEVKRIIMIPRAQLERLGLRPGNNDS